MVNQSLSIDKRNKIVELWKKGMSHRGIMKELGVSSYSCSTYLKGIKRDAGWLEQEWKKAEKEAKDFLEKNGFKHILNLNVLTSNPYWDYYCELDKQKWLIDVTINENKDVVDKFARRVEGYNCAILFKKKDNTWQFFEIKIIQKFI